MQTIQLDEVPAPVTVVDEYGLPIGFFEETSGAFQGEPLVRGHQGEYEMRLELE